MITKRFKTVDEYIKYQPKEVATRLKEVRKIVAANAPKAEEKISYNMPYYGFNGRFLYFAGYPKHIGFYPMPSAITKFKKEIEKKYKWAKGSVQFPHDKPLPVGLIKKMVQFRYKEKSVLK